MFIGLISACFVLAIVTAMRARGTARVRLAYGALAVAVVCVAALIWRISSHEPAKPQGLVALGLSAGFMDMSAAAAELDIPGVQTAPQSLPPVPAMIQQLESRLQAEPADAKGWSLLAKSYAYVGDGAGVESAIAAAVRLGIDEGSLRTQVEAVRRSRQQISMD